MSTIVNVPALGESIQEGTLSEWLVSLGGTVSVDDSVCSLETDKVSIDVPSPVSGTVVKYFVQEGEDINVGSPLFEVEEGDVKAVATPTDKATPVVATDAVKQEIAAIIEPTPQPSTTPLPTTSAADKEVQTTSVKPSVAAAKIARDHDIDLATVTPSGPKGNIVKGDVLNHQPQQKQAVAPTMTPSLGHAPTTNNNATLPERPIDPRGEERVRLSKLRQVIARRLKETQNTAALLTTFNEVNMANLISLRKEYKDMFFDKHQVKLGFMSFFVKAVTIALKELPSVNAEIYGNEIIYKNYYDIGIAVGSPQGLVVPVLRDADSLSFADIEHSIADFGRRARDGKLTINEMMGGTYTVTNGGIFGSLLSTPIINPPQSGILGMHKIQERPIVENGNIVAAPMMYLAHSYDHRIIDGREAVTFLVKIKDLLEKPERLLLDV